MISIVNDGVSLTKLINIAKHSKNIVAAPLDDDACELQEKDLSIVQIVGCKMKNADELINFLAANSTISLREFNLSFNLFRIIPSLSAFSGLTVLDVSHNRLESLSFVSSLPSLATLRCHGNNISSLQSFHGSSFRLSLEELWISDNNIEWQQFAYILDYSALKICICSENPSDSKPKLLEFLSKVLPALTFLNGERINLPKETSSPCLKELTTDEKVLLTQLKAFIRQQQEVIITTSHDKLAANHIEKSGELSDDEKSAALLKETKRSLSRTSSKVSISSTDENLTKVERKQRLLSHSAKGEPRSIRRHSQRRDESSMKNASSSKLSARPYISYWNYSPEAANTTVDCAGITSKSLVAVDFQPGLKLEARYRTGNLAVTYDLQTGVGIINDNSGNKLLDLTGEQAVKLPSGTTIMRSNAQLSDAPEQLKNGLSWVEDSLNIVFQPNSWSIEVSIVRDKNSDDQPSDIISSSLGLISSLQPHSAPPAGMAVQLLMDRKSNKRRSKKQSTRKPSGADQLSLETLNANLDQMLTDMKQMRGENAFPHRSESK